MNNRPRETLLVVGSAAGGFSGALAAVIAGLCCAGPAAVSLLGAGGAVAAARWAPYRPILLVGSALLFAFGFWRTYGQRATIAGDACPVRVGRVARAVLWASAVVWLAALWMSGLN